MALLHSLDHHFLECFVILEHFVFLFHAWSTIELSLLTMCLRTSLLVMLDVSKFLKDKMTSSKNAFSTLLFCWIESFEVLMILSSIGMIMVKGAWSDMRRQSEWMEC